RLAAEAEDDCRAEGVHQGLRTATDRLPQLDRFGHDHGRRVLRPTARRRTRPARDRASSGTELQEQQLPLQLENGAGSVRVSLTSRTTVGSSSLTCRAPTWECGPTPCASRIVL